MQVGHVDLRQPPAQIALRVDDRVDDARRQLGALARRWPACLSSAPDEPVDDRQVELAVPADRTRRSPCRIDRSDTADSPAGRSRSAAARTTRTSTVDGSDAPKRRVGDPRRLEQAAPAGGQIGGQDASTAESMCQRLHLAARQPHVAVHDDPADLQRRRTHDQIDGAIARIAEEHQGRHVPARPCQRDA